MYYVMALVEGGSIFRSKSRRLASVFFIVGGTIIYQYIYTVYWNMSKTGGHQSDDICMMVKSSILHCSARNKYHTTSGYDRLLAEGCTVTSTRSRCSADFERSCVNIIYRTYTPSCSFMAFIKGCFLHHRLHKYGFLTIIPQFKENSERI